MQVTARPFETRGSGAPDYEKIVWRAATWKRLPLRADETFVQFVRTFSPTPSPFSWCRAPLASGATASLVDTATGLPSPYIVAAGYELEVLMIWASLDRPVRMGMDLEGFLAGEYYLAASTIYFESEVKEMTTRDIDPSFSNPHIMNFWGTNLGDDVMRGYSKVVCILREHGSVRPTSKEVFCKGCEKTHEVPIETTIFTCPECGALNLYEYYPWGIPK